MFGKRSYVWSQRQREELIYYSGVSGWARVLRSDRNADSSSGGSFLHTVPDSSAHASLSIRGGKFVKAECKTKQVRRCDCGRFPVCFKTDQGFRVLYNGHSLSTLNLSDLNLFEYLPALTPACVSIQTRVLNLSGSVIL